MAKSTRLQKSPYCNDKVLEHVIAVTGETPKLIKEIIDFHSRFIAGKIKAGGFESVRIGRFGNFTPKMKKLVAKGYGTKATYTLRNYGAPARGPRRDQSYETL